MINDRAETHPIRIRAVAITIRDGQVLLMHRIKRGQEYYVFPGGGVEPGETAEQAVAREMLEETSVVVEVGKLFRHLTSGDGSEQFYYLCRYISGEPRLGDHNEAAEMAKGDNFYEPAWYDVEELPKLLLYPLEIRDLLVVGVANASDKI